MKILFVSNTSWYLFNFRKQLLSELVEMGVEVHALAPYDRYSEGLRKIGVSYHHISLSRSGINPLLDVVFALRLLRFYFSLRPNIVHHFTIKPVIFGSITANLFKNIKVVNAIPGLGYSFNQKGFIHKIVKLLYRVANRPESQYIFQNPDDQALFLSNRFCCPEQCHLILSSGVDTEWFKPANSSSRMVRFGLMGRMLKSKGVELYVDAAKAVHDAVPNTIFQILGDPDDGHPDSVSRDWLESLSINYDYIIWEPHLDDVRPFFGNIDIFVLPTYYPEGVPRSLTEAAASGLPLIATDTPGCREIISDGCNGYMVPVKNLELLTDRMMKLARDTGLRAEMGQASRMTAKEKFRVQEINRMTRNVYQLLGCRVDSPSD